MKYLMHHLFYAMLKWLISIHFVLFGVSINHVHVPPIATCCLRHCDCECLTAAGSPQVGSHQLWLHVHVHCASFYSCLIATPHHHA